MRLLAKLFSSHRFRMVCLFLVVLLAFLMNGLDHRFSLLSTKQFKDGDFFSERFVLHRLVYDMSDPADDQGGFLLVYRHIESGDRPGRKEMAGFDFTDQDAGIKPYRSHYGLQDDLLSPLWQGLGALRSYLLTRYDPESRQGRRLLRDDIYHRFVVSGFLVALLSALSLTLFVLWAAREFSPKHGLVTAVLILILIPGLGFFGRNLWWMMWSWYLPFLSTLYVFQANPLGHYGRTWLGLAGALVFATILLKALMGYEFIPTIMVSATVPVFYYGVKNAWPLSRMLAWLLVIGLAALAGICAAVALHFQALEAIGLDGWTIFQSGLARRSQMLGAGSQVSFWAVLVKHLALPNKMAVPQLLILLPVVLWFAGYFRRHRAGFAPERRRTMDGFAAAFVVSLCGAISMFVVLKAHAEVHGFDVIVWSLPLNLMIFAWASVWLFARYRIVRRVPE